MWLFAVSEHYQDLENFRSNFEDAFHQKPKFSEISAKVIKVFTDKSDEKKLFFITTYGKNISVKTIVIYRRI